MKLKTKDLYERNEHRMMQIYREILGPEFNYNWDKLCILNDTNKITILEEKLEQINEGTLLTRLGHLKGMKTDFYYFNRHAIPLILSALSTLVTGTWCFFSVTSTALSLWVKSFIITILILLIIGYFVLWINYNIQKATISLFKTRNIDYTKELNQLYEIELLEKIIAQRNHISITRLDVYIAEQR